MSDVMFTEYLRNFGLTGQEAIIYEVLLRNDAMTGYEIAKESGLSRSNVYGSLSALVDKGAAYVVEGESTKYISVAVDKFCDHTISELVRQGNYLKQHAPEKREDMGGYITLIGSRHIRDVISDMLDSCEQRLYIFAEAEFIAGYDDKLQELVSEGKKVVIMTQGYHLDGAIMYEAEPEHNQIRFITDSSHVLTGQCSNSEFDRCLFSDEPNLIDVMKEALSNKMKLVEIEKRK